MPTSTYRYVLRHLHDVGAPLRNRAHGPTSPETVTVT
jgi:hypothetical protein